MSSSLDRKTPETLLVGAVLLSRKGAAGACAVSLTTFDKHLRPHLTAIAIGSRLLYKTAEILDVVERGGPAAIAASAAATKNEKPAPGANGNPWGLSKFEERPLGGQNACPSPPTRTRDPMAAQIESKLLAKIERART